MSSEKNSPMTRAHARRLIKLARFLVGVKKRLFNMNSYTHETHCGTAHCVLGWACTLPSFKRAGLTLTTYYNNPLFTPRGKERKLVEMRIKNENPHISKYWISKYSQEFTVGEAGRLFFGPTMIEESTLFYDGFSMTPRQKALQILDIVSEHHPDLIPSKRAALRLVTKKRTVKS